MWFCMNDSFLSCVADKNSDGMLVRARRAGDIGAVFPDVEVIHTPGNDYAYRAFLPKEVVAKAIYDRIMGVGYTNFKNSVKDHERHDAYLEVWSIMHRYQMMEKARRNNFRRKGLYIR